ncbi:flavodoxin domain-containing protein [Lacticaseibacillus brantae]|uniref:Flavodoxin domain-containing protein n=1 Tax=Lacticaseibacillus brantae DSM 23927 TaxID=1423727 RepID=A0A0R2AWX1_9LACO|nr:flavodoxin domain-containing protein [Lacticaseibacillus brantae]KRM71953.1 hypothetical protein FC34_GL000933 [Lacticaseibacillus brantae DSM 23927]
MEDAIVIYTSKTGFTQQYALWIARALHCEILDSKFVTAEDLNNRRIVIYGGHVVSGHVTGLQRFYRRYQASCAGRVLVFGTGLLKETSMNLDKVAAKTKALLTTNEPFYYFQGSVTTDAVPLWRRVQLAYLNRKYHNELACSEAERITPLVRHVQQQI